MNVTFGKVTFPPMPLNKIIWPHNYLNFFDILINSDLKQPLFLELSLVNIV